MRKPAAFIRLSDKKILLLVEYNKMIQQNSKNKKTKQNLQFTDYSQKNFNRIINFLYKVNAQ